jgi:hypothetical protein
MLFVLLQASACITLMGALVTSGSTVGARSDPRQVSSSSMSLEVVRAMRDAGAVKALAQALKLISTEHPKVGLAHSQTACPWPDGLCLWVVALGL